MDVKAMKSVDLVSGQGTSLDLAEAVRRARIEIAEKSAIASDLVAAEYSRLDVLKENLKPVLSQLPREADLFNHGLVPGERPRFYVDMIAFVEMSRDRRTYRFLMDTPTGRQLLGESDDVLVMASAVTNYLGRRLVERESALAHAMSFEPLDTTSMSATLELEHSGSIATLPVITEAGRKSGGSYFLMFLLGLLAGIAAVYLGTNWDNWIIPELARLTTLLTGR